MNDAELNSVTEPHDFSNEHLVSLDTSLRCSICKDLINVPVFTPCSHSFCSMCIRESLLVNPTCPVCRAGVSDGQLKRNTMLSEIVEAYKLARDIVLRHERIVLVQSKNSALGKRKRSDASSSNVEAPKSARMNLDMRNPFGRPSRNNSHHDSELTKAASEGQSMVSCPVCEDIIDAQFINQHLDQNCDLGQTEIEASKKHGKDGSTQAKAWAKLLSANTANGSSRLKSSKSHNMDEIPLKRMSKVNYDIKSTKQLRELLAEVGLNDRGDAAQLKLRHERFVNLWNSEIDAAKPRPRSSLLRDMVEWENARTRARPTPKMDNPEAWLNTNRTQFDQLISNARPKARLEQKESDDSDGGVITVLSSSPPSPSSTE